MIVNARVDERLVHGQVATVWTNLLGAGRIVVVNDLAVKDDLQIGALKIAKPSGVKLSIVSVAKAISNFKENKYIENVFLITKNIADMRSLIDSGINIPIVNIGNLSKKEGSRSIKKSVALTDKDIADIEHIISIGVKVTAQMLPTESDESIMNFIK